MTDQNDSHDDDIPEALLALFDIDTLREINERISRNPLGALIQGNFDAQTQGYDIPKDRRDVSKKKNVRWLLRNIRANNKDQPNIKDIIDLLKELRNMALPGDKVQIIDGEHKGQVAVYHGIHLDGKVSVEIGGLIRIIKGKVRPI